MQNQVRGGLRSKVGVIPCFGPQSPSSKPPHDNNEQGIEGELLWREMIKKYKLILSNITDLTQMKPLVLDDIYSCYEEAKCWMAYMVIVQSNLFCVHICKPVSHFLVASVRQMLFLPKVSWKTSHLRPECQFRFAGRGRLYLPSQILAPPIWILCLQHVLNSL